MLHVQGENRAWQKMNLEFESEDTVMHQKTKIVELCYHLNLNSIGKAMKGI